MFFMIVFLNHVFIINQTMSAVMSNLHSVGRVESEVRIVRRMTYSTLRGKTDKLEEAENRELNITRSRNFIQTVDLV